jgi:hypothetical protein
MIAKCVECGAHVAITVLGGNDELWQHADVHRYGEATIRQLPHVSFREHALAAIRALAVTGRPFTLGECHELVPVQPLNPQTEWPAALREAIRLGWVEWTGDYTDSQVPTTKASAVKVWRGTFATRRAS